MTIADSACLLVIDKHVRADGTRYEVCGQRNDCNVSSTRCSYNAHACVPPRILYNPRDYTFLEWRAMYGCYIDQIISNIHGFLDSMHTIGGFELVWNYPNLARYLERWLYNVSSSKSKRFYFLK